MEIQELRQKTEEELKKFLSEIRDRSRVLKFDLASGKVKNVREIRAVRKDISRTITILKEKKLLWKKTQ